jgi:hypothetical protein
MSRKYNAFRSQHRFVAVLSNSKLDGEQGSIACCCCSGTKHDMFLTQFSITEERIDIPQQKLGTLVEREICTKCLQYIFGQKLGIYKAERRQHQYRIRFRDLYEWCSTNRGPVAVFPTLNRFFLLCSAGEQFKPELVAHVSRLVYLLKNTPGLMQYANRLAAEPVPDAVPPNIQKLRIRIDSLEPPLTAEEYTIIDLYVKAPV